MKHIEGWVKGIGTVSVPMSSVLYFRRATRTKDASTTVWLVNGDSLVFDGDVIEDDRPEMPRFSMLLLKDGRQVTISIDAIAYLDWLTETMTLKDGTKLELGTPVRVIQKWIDAHQDEFVIDVRELDQTETKPGPEQMRKWKLDQEVEDAIERKAKADRDEWEARVAASKAKKTA